MNEDLVVPAPAGIVGINLPAGVNFDGKGHTLTPAGKGHVIGATDGEHVISNVVITTANKSGIVAYGANTKLTLQDVEISGCPETAVQVVNGATVIINGLKTKENGWGAINVDYGLNGAAPNVTVNSAEMAENVEIYTEIIDEDVITAPGFEEVIGHGAKLKGFKYFSSDLKRLGVGYCEIDGVKHVYETVAEGEAAAAEAGVDFVLL